MDAMIAGLAVAALTGLTWAAYAHPGAPFRPLAWTAKAMLFGLAVGVIGYQAGTMHTENAALGAITSANIETYAAARHAMEANQAPWWSLGACGLGALYVVFLESLSVLGIVKRGP